MRLAPMPLSLLPVLLCLALAAPVASAQDATLDNAKSLIATQQGKGRAAFDLLAPLEQQRAGEPAFDYLYGLAAIDAGEFTRAVFALERVLAVEPNHPQARAEIARAYFLMGENKAARTEFEAVKAARPPADVAATIDRFLNALDARQAGSLRSGVTGYLEIGTGHDSNVNTATGASGFAAPGIGTFTLNPGATSRSDTFYAINGGINGRYALSNQWSLTGGANYSRRFNSQAKRGETFIGATRIPGIDTFDTISMDANAGVAYTQGEHEFSALAQVQSFYVDNNRFRDAVGGLLQWRYALSAAQQVVTYLQSSRLTFPNLPFTVPGPGVPAQTDRNAYRNVIGVAWANAIDVKFLPTIYAGLYLGEERLMTGAYPEFGHKLFGVRAGGQVTLTPNMTAFANMSYEDRHYGFPTSTVNLLLFPFNRVDREWNLRLGGSYAFSKNWSVGPALTVTDARSNVATSAYRRTMAQVMLRYDFR